MNTLLMSSKLNYFTHWMFTLVTFVSKIITVSWILYLYCPVSSSKISFSTSWIFTLLTFVIINWIMDILFWQVNQSYVIAKIHNDNIFMLEHPLVMLAFSHIHLNVHICLGKKWHFFGMENPGLNFRVHSLFPVSPCTNLLTEI